MYKGKTLPPRATEHHTDQYLTTELGEAAGLGFMLAWELGSLNDLMFPAYHVGVKSVELDVPVMIEGQRWKEGPQRPYASRHGEVDGVARGFSPEERWQALYDWAASRVRWNLPVAV
jgi:hypothetical protein